jgi:hypothetical protein
VQQPCILKSVKVYTDAAGQRLIELRNSSGTVLQSLLVNIPLDTTIVTLNFSLAPGTAYQLGTNATQNQASFGYDSPRLRRNTLNVAYPYTINNLLSITTSDFGNTRYFYFYDWQVEVPPTVCMSERTPAYVDLLTGIQSISGSSGISLFPNPVAGLIHVRFEKEIISATRICLVDLTGREILHQDYKTIVGGQEVEIQTAPVAAGTYLLQVSNDGSSWTQRVSIMK